VLAKREQKQFTIAMWRTALTTGQDPLIAPEVLVRKLVGTHYRGEENEFMPERIMNAMAEQQAAATAAPTVVEQPLPAMA
jgi:hypothetical protein